MMNIKRTQAVQILIAAALSALSGLAHAQQTLDRIVAVVNEGIVLESELQDEYTDLVQYLSANKIEMPPAEVLKKQLLDKLIIEHLQLQEADRYGLEVDDTTLNNALRQIAERNNLSLDEFRRELLKDGKDYLEYREQVRKEITLNQLTQSFVNSRVVVSEAEIDDYLANSQNASGSEYLVSQIQISLPEAATSEVIQKAQEKANAIFEKLRGGADFAQLAVSESDGRNALEGGDLGWNRLSALPSRFSKEILELKVGEFSRPIRSPRGFHILLLRDTKGIERHLVKQVRARHILIAPNTLLSDEQVRLKLLDLRKQILDGADFAKLAEEHSEDPGSAAKGGELDWAEPRVYVPQFQRVVETLPLNKISEPFRTEHGWHIVEVLGRRDYDATIEYQRWQARQDIHKRKAAVEEELWIRRLRDEAYIEYRLDQG
ncbi:MAG TPA: peptidylprolyl isomerase [Gammaproteobacteria bacterium]